MKVYAPGKLILSGEHAVVHGAPAVAMAVNRYAKATITEEESSRIHFDLSDLAHKSNLTLLGLGKLKAKVKKKYHKFLRGEYTIRQVLHKPFELAQVALGVLTESNNVSLPHGVKIHMQSDIPIGSGMGSSAATILSVMYATSTYLNISLTEQQLFDAAIQAENMQHGHSSGLDLRVALKGGCLYVNGDEIKKIPEPTFKLFLVNTGKPESSTGECVSKVAPFFQNEETLSAFTDVTNRMAAALEVDDVSAVKSAIKQNHQLLVQIGVVPEVTNQFISTIESMKGAAKICGAGAVVGNHAGLVLAVVDDESELKKLCRRHHYDLMTIECEPRGVHVV